MLPRPRDPISVRALITEPHGCNNPGNTPVLNSGDPMEDEPGARLGNLSRGSGSQDGPLEFRVPPGAGGPAYSTRPTFSIVIPAYEASAVIGRAVRSALAQTEAAKEIIVVDDGSTDDLASALLPFSQIVLLPSPHVGLPGVRNLALQRATGDFIAFLDADDELEPDFLAALNALAAYRPDLDILTTDSRFVVNGRLQGTFYQMNAFPIDDQRMAMLGGSFITTLTAVRRSRLLEVGGFNARLKHGEDWECWLRLVLGGSRVGLVDAPLSRYHLHQAQMSARRGESLRGRLDIMTTITRTHPEVTDTDRRQLGRPLRDLSVRAALASGADGDAKEARRIWLDLARNRECRTPMRAAAVLGAVVPRMAGRHWPGLKSRARGATRRLPRWRATR